MKVISCGKLATWASRILRMYYDYAERKYKRDETRLAIVLTHANPEPQFLTCKTGCYTI